MGWTFLSRLIPEIWLIDSGPFEILENFRGAAEGRLPCWGEPLRVKSLVTECYIIGTVLLRSLMLVEFQLNTPDQTHPVLLLTYSINLSVYDTQSIECQARTMCSQSQARVGRKRRETGDWRLETATRGLTSSSSSSANTHGTPDEAPTFCLSTFILLESTVQYFNSSIIPTLHTSTDSPCWQSGFPFHS